MHDCMMPYVLILHVVQLIIPVMLVPPCKAMVVPGNAEMVVYNLQVLVPWHVATMTVQAYVMAQQ
jgi:hypothetical protein